MTLKARRQIGLVGVAAAAVVASGLWASPAPALGESGLGADTPAVAFTSTAIENGLPVKLSGRNITIGIGECFVHDKPVRVSQAMTVKLPPCAVRSVSAEPVQLSIEPLAGQGSRTVLAMCRATAADTVPVKRVLAPGSVRVRASADPQGKVLQSGKDYLIDTTWGAIVATTTGAIKNNQTVYVDYMYFTRRLDTIGIDENGQLKLTIGVPARTAPIASGGSERQLALANVYAPIGAEPLATSDFLPIYSVDPPALPQAVRDHNRRALSKTRAKIASGGPVSILFWGDSITGGCDASAPSKGLVARTAAQLRRLYPSCQFTFMTAAVGGTTTTKRLPTLDVEVLSKHPDLVVMEFVNDVHIPESELQTNYQIIAEKCKAAGVEMLAVTPHWPAPQLMGTPNWKSVSKNKLYGFLRTFTQKNNWALADVEARWGKLSENGLSPELMLVDNLVHVNDTGHAIYAQEIVRAIE